MENKIAKLTECQKDFLLNSKYGLSDIHPNHNAIDFVCEKRNIGVGIYVSEDCVEDYFTLTKKVFESISSCCEDCVYYKKNNPSDYI